MVNKHFDIAYGRMRREQEDAERRLQLEVEQQRELERRDLRTVQGQAEDRRRQAIIRRQELQARLTTDSLKVGLCATQPKKVSS